MGAAVAAAAATAAAGAAAAVLVVAAVVDSCCCAGAAAAASARPPSPPPMLSVNRPVIRFVATAAAEGEMACAASADDGDGWLGGGAGECRRTSGGEVTAAGAAAVDSAEVAARGLIEMLKVRCGAVAAADEGEMAAGGRPAAGECVRMTSGGPRGDSSAAEGGEGLSDSLGGTDSCVCCCCCLAC